MRFAADAPASPDAPAPPQQQGAAPCRELKLGLVLAGGTYATDICPLPAAGGAPLASGTSSCVSLATERRGGEDVLVLHLAAERPGPFDARLSLLFPGQEQAQEVHVTATVISRHKGTPGLRPDVRCLGFSAETDLD